MPCHGKAGISKARTPRNPSIFFGGLASSDTPAVLKSRPSLTKKAKTSGIGPAPQILEGDEFMSEPTKEELMARIAELENQVGGRKRGSLEFRVGEKGGVSVYGLGRFPVTLYYEQWIRLLDAADSLRAFLEENKSRLKLKPKE
jgi:hypothetical protein